jgi:hypothetical protein
MVLSIERVVLKLSVQHLCSFVEGVQALALAAKHSGCVFRVKW